jgi:hypothetical protein
VVRSSVAAALLGEIDPLDARGTRGTDVQDQDREGGRKDQALELADWTGFPQRRLDSEGRGGTVDC